MLRPYPRVQNTMQIASVTHRQTGASVRVLGSDPRRAHGLAPVLVLCDEPSQWPESTGERMVAALRTAAGKQPHCRFVALGTRPAEATHWFERLLSGGAGFAMTFAAAPGDPPYRKRTWARANPSLGHMPDLEAADPIRGRKRKSGSGACRTDQLLQKPHIRAAIAARSAAVVNHDHQRAEDDARVAALTREVDIDRLARLELTALLDLEEAERKQKLFMRLHHEVMAGGRCREGSQGGAQSRFARVCRQYRGEPAHREPGRCCCGSLATSPRGASCDRCRERNRHYRRRYRAKVRRLRAV